MEITNANSRFRPIAREDIVGARIVSIHGTYELLKGWIDYRRTYFTVDRGFTFTMPWGGRLWTMEDLPDNAKLQPDEIVEPVYAIKRSWIGKIRYVEEPSKKIDTVKKIKQRTIAGVYCHKRHEEFYCPDDTIILFDDGSIATEIGGSPQGTGGAGLHFYTEESDAGIVREKLVDYFTIPVKEKL